jgi:hypothetical protein
MDLLFSERGHNAKPYREPSLTKMILYFKLYLLHLMGRFSTKAKNFYARAISVFFRRRIDIAIEKQLDEADCMLQHINAEKIKNSF